MGEAIFTNARVVTADAVFAGTVAVRDSRIAAVDEGVSALPAALDLEGDLLIPGLVELHTDNVERHVLPRPSAPWPVAAAVLAHDRELAGAGITTVFDAIGVGEVHTRAGRMDMLAELCESIGRRAAAGEFVADHRIHLRCEVSYGGLPAMFDPLIDDPLVGLVSVMDHTPGQRQFHDIAVYADYYQRKHGMSEAELARFMDERRRDHERYARANRRHVVGAARARGLAVASHDDATEAHVREAAEDGMVIAEFPTTAEAAEASRALGLSVLMGAPNLVRGGSHSGNVSARELATSGLLDIVSSDYVPSSLLFGALMLAHMADGIDLAAAIRAVSLTPAARVGLADRGEIAPGKRADLVRVRDAGEVPLIRGVWRGGEKVA